MLRHPIRLAHVLLALLAFTPLCEAAAAPYPDRAITMVVPFSPGGGTDVLARLIGAKLQIAMGQPVVVENRAGANGAIASRSVLSQPADGYTLLFASHSTQVIAPLVARQAGRPMEPAPSAFTALSILANAPLVLAVNANSPYHTLAEYLAGAKSRDTTFGTFGVGSSAHLMGAMLAASSRAQLTHVPYKGSSPATTDLLGNQVDSVILTVAAIDKLVDAGKLRALAVSSKARVSALPTVPTLAESGFTGMSDTGWFAVFAPTKTPTEISDSLSTALARIVAEESVRTKMLELGLEPVGSSMDEARTIWQRSMESAASILSKVKIDLQ
ncbi:MAG: tripartite tricarboxylate transporter substrate binding protein [Burkholderiales bacterium]